MAEIIPSINDIKIRALNEFEKHFGEKAVHAVSAPGRVNIIGEHTDYNEGFVLPMALPLVTVIVGKANGTNNCVIVSASSAAASGSRVEFDVSNRQALKPADPQWANYSKGCIANFPSPVPGFNAVIVSSVPVGAGLSSSAALEVATYTFLESLTGQKTDKPETKALACQKAEHDFAGVPCGIMDQFISVMGQQGSALLLDCRDLLYTHIPMSNCANYAFLITNSNSPHKLSSSAYCERRDVCFDAAKKLGKKSLRDATVGDIETLKSHGASEVMLKRVRHVVTENLRTQETAKALQAGDYQKVGELMNASHNSLRDDYQVSSSELDILVDTARKGPGVLGSRLTGAGFGGCTITLLKEKHVDEVVGNIQKTYTGKATFYIAKASNGAQQLDC